MKASLSGEFKWWGPAKLVGYMVRNKNEIKLDYFY